MDNKKSERNKIGACIYLIDEINVTSQCADALQLCLEVKISFLFLHIDFQKMWNIINDKIIFTEVLNS